MLVGPVQQGNWTSYIGGLYAEGLTALIAHFKVAGLHLALEAETKVLSKTGGLFLICLYLIIRIFKYK